MAVSELFACDQCAFDAVLVHAQEWQPGPKGETLPYPGFGVVGGLANQLWCPVCLCVRHHRFVTLNPPATHAVVAYAEAQRLSCDGTEVGPCSTCGATLTWDVDGVPCPVCTDGILRFTGEWEDAV